MSNHLKLEFLHRNERDGLTQRPALRDPHLIPDPELHAGRAVGVVYRRPLLVPFVLLHEMLEFSLHRDGPVPFRGDHDPGQDLAAYRQDPVERAVPVGAALAGCFDVQAYVSWLFSFCQDVHLSRLILSSGRCRRRLPLMFRV